MADGKPVTPDDWVTVTPTAPASPVSSGSVPAEDWQTAPPGDHNTPGALERFWNSFTGAVNPAPGIEQWWQRISHSREDWNSMADALHTGIKARGREMTPEEQAVFDKGQEALQRQDLQGGAPPVLPPIIQPAAHAAVQAISGDFAGAGGTLAGAYGVPYAVGEGIGLTGRALKAEPVTAMVRALKPTPSDVGFTDRLPQTMANIQEASSTPITNNEQLIRASQFAIRKHQAAFDQWVNANRNLPISGNEIAAAGSAAIPETLWVEDPAGAGRIRQQVTQGYANEHFAPAQLKQLLEEKNAELKGFYSRSPAQQSAASSGLPYSVLKAQRDAIANTLYNALDPEHGGLGPRQIQLQTGDMLDMLEAAQARRNAIIGEKPVSLAGKYGRAATRLAALPGKAITGEIEEGLTNLRGALSGTSDPLIARAFGSIGRPMPLPQPQGFVRPMPRQIIISGTPQLGILAAPRQQEDQ